MIKRTRILTLILLTCLFGLSACIYHPTVQQGNILTESDLHAVRRGMSLRTVTKTLGNPVLNNIYPDGRVVYIYTLQPNHEEMKKRQLIVTFRSGRVVNYTVQNQDIRPEL